MFEWLSQVDTALFYAINVGLANPVTDLFMPFITNDWVLRFLFAMALVLLLWKGDRKLRWSVLFVVLAVGAADFASAGWLKGIIGRIRPCHVLENVHLLVGCGAGKSMPSAHAANSFAIAAFYGISFPNVRWYLVGLAVAISLSRVFCGVHYPGDVLVGAFLGAGIGTAFTIIYQKTVARAPMVPEPSVITPDQVIPAEDTDASRD